MSLSISEIRKSFSTVEENEGLFTSIIYEQLFTRLPEVVTLFKDTDIEKQKRLLMNSLGFMLKNLDNVEKLAEFLQNLGERHSSYGVEEKHFAVFQDAIMVGLEKCLGDSWNENTSNFWQEFLSNIMLIIMQGMRSANIHLNTAQQNRDESETTQPIAEERLEQMVQPAQTQQETVIVEDAQPTSTESSGEEVTASNENEVVDEDNSTTLKAVNNDVDEVTSEPASNTQIVPESTGGLNGEDVSDKEATPKIEELNENTTNDATQEEKESMSPVNDQNSTLNSVDLKIDSLPGELIEKIRSIVRSQLQDAINDVTAQIMREEIAAIGEQHIQEALLKQNQDQRKVA